MEDVDVLIVGAGPVGLLPSRGNWPMSRRGWRVLRCSVAI